MFEIYVTLPGDEQVYHDQELHDALVTLAVAIKAFPTAVIQFNDIGDDNPHTLFIYEKGGLHPLYGPGDRITVKESAVLGTPEANATIVGFHKFGYIVHVDGDQPGWDGPVDFAGNVLLE